MFQQLQVQVTTLLAANRTGGQVRTDFSTFPTPQFAKVSTGVREWSSSKASASGEHDRGSPPAVPDHVSDLTHFVSLLRISRFDQGITSARKPETFVLDQYFRFCVPSVGVAASC